MLNVEQQTIIENSIWVVNTALKRQGLSADEDLRQSALLYMCSCLERFDASRGIKWTTFAYKNVYLYIKRVHKQNVDKRGAEISDETVYALQAVELPLEAEKALDPNILTINELKRLCSPTERQIINYKLQGYKSAEISRKMGCSVSSVSRYMNSIRTKARELKV